MRARTPHEVKCTVFTASLPGYPTSVTVSNAIKNRASNEEILAILKEVPNPNQEDDDGTGQILYTLSASVCEETTDWIWELNIVSLHL